MLEVSNSNVTMKFVQDYFYHKSLGGQKILCLPCPKVGGTCLPFPLLNSVFAFESDMCTVSQINRQFYHCLWQNQKLEKKSHEI